jgi:hypothetical protein
MSTHAVHVDEISVWSWVAIAVFAWLLVALLLLAPHDVTRVAGPMPQFADPALIAPEIAAEPRV